MQWRKLYQSNTEQTASIPMRIVGPVRIVSAEMDAEVPLPLATFETPLWPSTHRGARVCTQAGGIKATVIDDRMTRSVLVEADSIIELQQIIIELQQKKLELQQVISQASRFSQLLAIHTQLVGSLLYIRFELSTGDAAGHNMVTLAAERMLDWILSRYPALRYVSISGNYCSDKKASAVNGILGRGKNVIAEVVISDELCQRLLHTTPEKIVNFLAQMANFFHFPPRLQLN